jgi:hypothetical protein
LTYCRHSLSCLLVSSMFWLELNNSTTHSSCQSAALIYTLTLCRALWAKMARRSIRTNSCSTSVCLGQGSILLLQILNLLFEELDLSCASWVRSSTFFMIRSPIWCLWIAIGEGHPQ